MVSYCKGQEVSGRAGGLGGGMALRRWFFGILCAAFAVYSAYVYTAGTQTPHQFTATMQVRQGQAIFQRQNCIACHQFYGLGGYMGPDLTNVATAPDKGAAYARAFIESGTERMPDLGLSDSQVDAVVAFLEFVGATENYPPEKPRMTWYGTVDYSAGQGIRQGIR